MQKTKVKLNMREFVVGGETELNLDEFSWWWPATSNVLAKGGCRDTGLNNVSGLVDLMIEHLLGHGHG